jgi:hypothetical protein
MFMVEKLLREGLLGMMDRDLRAMPRDLVDLRKCLAMVVDMLAEKASEHERTWALAAGAAAEVETLLQLESAIARRAAELRAGTLRAVLDKLAIWELLAQGDSDGEESSLGRPLLRSVIADLRRMARQDRPRA